MKISDVYKKFPDVSRKWEIHHVKRSLYKPFMEQCRRKLKNANSEYPMHEDCEFRWLSDGVKLSNRFLTELKQRLQLMFAEEEKSADDLTDLNQSNLEAEVGFVWGEIPYLRTRNNSKALYLNYEVDPSRLGNRILEEYWTVIHKTKLGVTAPPHPSAS
jgi:hypothetical protein